MSDVQPIKRRLKGLDEFETPEFVGRIARIEQRRKLIWYSTVIVTIVLGAVIELLL